MTRGYFDSPSLGRMAALLVLTASIACGEGNARPGGAGDGDGDGCDPSQQGFVTCGDSINQQTCQPGQYCADQTFGECGNGCLADVNCACNQTCSISAGETVGTCRNRAPAAVCGDGTCNGGENSGSCPGDCPVTMSPRCGDGVCNGGENSGSCAADCPAAGPVCGDRTCDGGETMQTCPADCGFDRSAECRDICSSYDFFDCFAPGELQTCFDRCNRATPAQHEQYINCGGTGAVSCDECRHYLP